MDEEIPDPTSMEKAAAMVSPSAKLCKQSPIKIIQASGFKPAQQHKIRSHSVAETSTTFVPNKGRMEEKLCKMP